MMKNLLALAFVLGAATTTLASQPALQPVPEQVLQGQIIGTLVESGHVELYDNVEYRRPRNIAPCAVKKIVSVPHPCNPCCCVYVAICVPPCGCETVSKACRRDAVTFDYGDYAVRITERRGTIIVTYLN